MNYILSLFFAFSDSYGDITNVDMLGETHGVDGLMAAHDSLTDAGFFVGWGPELPWDEARESFNALFED